MAAIIAGKKVGVDSNTIVVAVKVLGGVNATGSMSGVIKGVEWGE